MNDLVLLADGGRFPLVAHTAESRAALQAQGGIWSLMDLGALTHYVADVPLPSDRALVLTVQGTRGTTEVLVSQLVHTPPDATRALAQVAADGGALEEHRRLGPPVAGARADGRPGQLTGAGR